ncbi:MAG: glycogen/starch synthase [Myxococcales bacterium]|nr:glycogen/starch synthase [Myxococcales bacterium]
MAPSTPRSTGKKAPEKPASSAPQQLEPLLMEVAWEVCNQVGGIYTVLRSKVPSMISRWGSRYCLVGPYNPNTAEVEFEPAPLVGAVGQAVQQLREMGYRAHYGRWLVSGRPHVVLLDLGSVGGVLNEIKYRVWADHQIPASDEPNVNDAVAFGEMCRALLSILAQGESQRRKIVAHFHEWQAGLAIPMLRKENWRGSLVFTTHATLIGRYVATGNPSFYDHLPFLDGDQEAKNFNVYAQHQIEKAAAHAAHVFTTVSDLTAEECTHLLGRTPDMLLPNGLNIRRFTAIHEFQTLHQQYKERLHEFSIGHFFPSYNFDLDTTLYMFTSGRYEYFNKGMDVTIEALARLNHRLRETASPVTVVFFIITKAAFRSINVRALQNRAMLNEFRTAADAVKESVGDGLFLAASSGEIPDLNELMEDYWRLRLRRAIHAWKSKAPPSIVTHDLVDDAHDPVLNQLRACRLFNIEDDPVKVVFHPDFVQATSPLFGMEYDQFVRGCHLGVFPSFYEPWGYTPLESIALGVPAVTSDLSGFGSYLKQLLPDHASKGIYVVPRRHNDFHRAAEELTNRLFEFASLGRRGRIMLRNAVESFSEHFDWHNLGRHYNEAHDLALQRVSG